MHMTATCYKQTTVVKDSTGEEPIFLGPMFIHDNSDGYKIMTKNIRNWI
jgi:hypothetical protein